MRTLSSEPGELTIRPAVWRAGNVVSAAVIVVPCVTVAVFQPRWAVVALACPVLILLMAWPLWRLTRLEITETEVRAKQRAVRGQADEQATRSEIRAIRYYPTGISFRGPDDQSLMKAADAWTMRQMVMVAGELRVPLYEHRGLLKLEELSEGRLVYDPASGPVVQQKLSVPGAVRG